MTDVAVKREPLTYERESPHSFFMDVARSQALHDDAATTRLDRHAVEQRVNPNATLGTGGEFTPPIYLVEDYITAAKIGRHFSAIIGSTPIPRTASTIYIPRFVGTNVLGQDTTVQTANAEAVGENDDTTSNSSSPVVGVVGKLDASQQLYDQAASPGFDVMAYAELRKDYNAVLENQLFNGTGANGQLTGLANYTIPTANTVDGTSVPATSPTMVTALWPLMGKAAGQVGNSRGHRPDLWLMAPRRWFAIASSLDSSNRPLNSPGYLGYSDNQLQPSNQMPHAVGNVLGQPCFTSGAILATGATGADSIYCLRVADLYLFESPEMVQTSVNAMSGTLQVRLLLHHYVAFVGNLYTSSIGVVKGIPQPTGY
jgi:hypothetical protein